MILLTNYYKNNFWVTVGLVKTPLNELWRNRPEDFLNCAPWLNFYNSQVVNYTDIDYNFFFDKPYMYFYFSSCFSKVSKKKRFNLPYFRIDSRNNYSFYNFASSYFFRYYYAYFVDFLRYNAFREKFILIFFFSDALNFKIDFFSQREIFNFLSEVHNKKPVNYVKNGTIVISAALLLEV